MPSTTWNFAYPTLTDSERAVNDFVQATSGALPAVGVSRGGMGAIRPT